MEEVVHAKPNAVGLAGPGAAEVVPYVDADLKHKVVEKAKALCLSKSVHGAMIEVFEGDARNILCEVVDKHHASLLVVGSHGYGAIKRYIRRQVTGSHLVSWLYSSLIVHIQIVLVCHGVVVKVHGAMIVVFEGDARNILCEVVDKHHASLLILYCSHFLSPVSLFSVSVLLRKELSSPETSVTIFSSPRMFRDVSSEAKQPAFLSSNVASEAESSENSDHLTSINN
ncbi:hypothetical protein F2Q70_00039955 [Brassica cretica]|uniref:UspA domain-containing protein n=1 Tax=Brassica cretica TaxID=69181 RepID=A0A8S9K372_BRACR|nr:hypothetical protein F2Q70_00039955 [Brassica cretica]